VVARIEMPRYGRFTAISITTNLLVTIFYQDYFLFPTYPIIVSANKMRVIKPTLLSLKCVFLSSDSGRIKITPSSFRAQPGD